MLTGFYGPFLEEWFGRFGDRFRVVFFEDLKADPQRLVSGLLEWLGLDPAPAFGFEYRVRNVTVVPKNASLHRLGRRLNARLGGALTGEGVAGAVLSSGYRMLNSKGSNESLSPELRARVDAVYRESNAAVCELLRRQGYSNLPGWLDPRGE